MAVDTSILRPQAARSSWQIELPLLENLPLETRRGTVLAAAGVVLLAAVAAGAAMGALGAAIVLLPAAMVAYLAALAANATAEDRRVAEAIERANRRLRREILSETSTIVGAARGAQAVDELAYTAAFAAALRTAAAEARGEDAAATTAEAPSANALTAGWH